MVRRFQFLVLILFLAFTACVPYKQMRYMANESSKSLDSIAYQNAAPYKLSVGDLINISVKSTTESNTELLSKIFAVTSGAVTNTNESNLYIQGYIVDSEGQVDIPYLGKIKVLGLSIEEAQVLVDQAFHEYLNHITVSLRLMSFRVSVLGEVTRPGAHIYYQNEVTIFQALAQAGDLTNYANRKQIKLIRHEAGEVKIYVFDLTKNNFFNQEFYRLKPNDMIYVEPIRAKVFAANSTHIALVMSFLTFTLVALTYFNK